jgi:DNA-binding MarR family transcriptional regulator
MNRDSVDQLLRQWSRERPRIDVSPLGVVVRIQLLAKRLQQQTTAVLRQHDLKHWEYDVLSVLRRQGEPFELPASEIAAAALLTSGAMTTRIDGLEKRGLVKRRRGRTDRRSILVRLTARGIKQVDAALQTRLEDARNALAGIGKKQQRHLAEALQELLANMEGKDGN